MTSVGRRSFPRSEYSIRLRPEGGYQKEIKKAERKLALLTARVARSLAPLGVTEHDIRELIENRMAKRHAAH